MGAVLSLLIPSDPLAPARPDDHFTWRARAAQEAGVPVAVFDADDLDAPRGVRRLAAGSTAVVQGWMLAADAYADVERAVGARGAALLTTRDAYARAHHVPGWYEVFADLTPPSVWLPADAAPADLASAARGLGSGAFVVKDWVKSRKHEWATACYAPGAGAVPGVAAEMLRLLDDGLVGGVVIRAFEDFTGEEARVWWVGGDLAVVTAHPDTPEAVVEPDLAGVGEAVRALGCPFVTTDLVRRADGAWRVVEVGDGQVSDFPRTGDYAALLAALSRFAGPAPTS